MQVRLLSPEPMALTKADVEMWAYLKSRGVIPSHPRVLEIGQANWYGDVPAPYSGDAFQVARAFYAEALNYSEIWAIDMHGPDATPFDLNEPIAESVLAPGTWDVVINTGTTEHIFDQRRVFQTIHDACSVGGLMIHAAPIDGWKDHGFYNYQPTFFRDLRIANGYEGLYSRVTDGPDVMLYVAFGKRWDTPFRVPIQGRYR